MPGSEAPGPQVMQERWERFAAFAERMLQKPAFDLEERIWKLEVATHLRRVLDSAHAGAEWISHLDGIFNGVFSGQEYDLTKPFENTWFDSVTKERMPLFNEVLSGFLDEKRKPVDRFRMFADAIGPPLSYIQPVQQASLVGAFGSLFNFAVDPAGLPFLRTETAEMLERSLGYAIDRDSSAVEKYERYLDFAADVRDRLIEGGVKVRDMIDLSSVISAAAQYRDFWASKPEDVVRARPPSDGAHPRVPYLSICAIYRDEAQYLAEWIEFHRLVGVERFFLYDHMSQDHHLDVLAPYIEEGTVVRHPWPVEGPAQAFAYDDCLTWHRHGSRWIAFIDVDEFLFSPTGKPVSELLQEYEVWPGVAVNWALHGFSGHRTKPAGLVIENYVRRVVNMPANKHIKSIVDPTRAVSVQTPHHFNYSYRCAVDENHYPVATPTTKSVSSSLLRVNHYNTKSEEEYLAKTARPRADAWPRLQFTVGDLPERREFEERYGEADGAILSYLPALKAALERRSAVISS
jgi:glycosyl transferase family 92